MLHVLLRQHLVPAPERLDGGCGYRVGSPRPRVAVGVEVNDLGRLPLQTPATFLGILHRGCTDQEPAFSLGRKVVHQAHLPYSVPNALVEYEVQPDGIGGKRWIRMAD